MSSLSGPATVAGKSAFTMSQWQELEHQALIYKYLISGLPVPPDLVLPIQKSLHLLSSPLFHHSPLGYSMFGKVDPEPGRCRRTDGKKWRCAKEAYVDSKYCERHMHRGRSRSRKPVESHSLSSSSSAFGSGSGSGSHQTQLQLDSIPYAIPTKDYNRYVQGHNKPEAGKHSSLSESSSSHSASPMYSTPANTMDFASTQVASFPMLQPSADYSPHSFLNCDFGLSQPGKQGSQNLRPFFELTSSKDSWSSLEDERVNQGSFSTPQFSISGPDFLSNSSQGE